MAETLSPTTYSLTSTTRPQDHYPPPQETFANSANDRDTLVVLDDYPTGIQRVHDVTVFTPFDRDVLVDLFNTKELGFFTLTNTRAFHHDEVIFWTFFDCQCHTVDFFSQATKVIHDPPRQRPCCRQRDRHLNRNYPALRLYTSRPLSFRKWIHR